MTTSHAAELRFVQLGALSLRLHTLDPELIARELTTHREQAPELMARASLVLDISQLGDESIDQSAMNALLEKLHSMGFRVVGMVSGGQAAEASRQLGLALLPSVGEIRLAAADARRAAQARAALTSAADSEPAESTQDSVQSSGEAVPAAQATLHLDHGVRSGQQVYARDADLVIIGSVSPGAEVIADGSIHVYGALRGRALAGATGNKQARVFCRDFQAELISVAGHYKVLEALPETLKGSAVQVSLVDGQLKLDTLG